MSLLFVLLLACSGDDPEPTDTDTTETDSDTETGVLTVDSSPTTLPTAETGATDTAPTGDTGGSTPTADTGIGIDLTGRTYRFTALGINIVQPTLPLYLVDTVFVIEVIEHDQAAGTMDLRIGNWDIYGAGQNRCAPTIDVLDVDVSTAPIVAFGPIDGAVTYGTTRYPFEEATVELTFDATYDEVLDATTTALVDSFDVSSSYYGGPGAFCSMLGACTACPSTGEVTCIPWETNSVRARWDPALTVAERTQADVQADPACN